MEIFLEILNKLVMLAAKIIAPMLFCYHLKHRKLFWLRVAAAAVAIVALDFIPTTFLSAFYYRFLYNTAMFIVLSLFMWLCFDEKYFTVLFCCVAGKCTMHIAEYLSMIVLRLVDHRYISVSAAFYAVIFVGFYFLFARRIKSEECVGINNLQIMLFAFAVAVISDLLLMIFIEFRVNDNIKITVYCMNIISCILTLCLQFGVLSESRIKREAGIINQLRIKEQEQYELSQETVKLIGIKHHDIKNMLESLKGKISTEDVASIDKLIDSYDIAFKTGNSALDTVLTEKFIACKRMNIRLESMANGEPLGFMSAADVYSLFLNILNNAIESADKLPDIDERVIQLKVYTRGELLFIQSQNRYADEIKFNRKNEIATTKADKRYHGYGLQSIKMIAQNYGGNVSVDTEDKIFKLAIVIPIPEKTIETSTPPRR